MIEEELKKYVHSLLKQGYDLETIRNALVKAGHEIRDVEKVTNSVFEVFHKDIIEYIDRELETGKSIEEIKEDLLSLGHTENHLKDVIRFHKSRSGLKLANIIKPKDLKSIIRTEGQWLKKWTIFYTYLFVGLIIIMIIISTVIIYSNSGSSTIDRSIKKNLDLCSSLSIRNNTKNISLNTDEKICLALVYSNINLCAELQGTDYSICADTFNIYNYYLTKNKNICSKINNINLKEYCTQIAEKACSNYFGYSGYCDSIINNSITRCTKQIAIDDNLIGNCQDNLMLYLAINANNSICNQIKAEKQKIFCQVIAKTQ